MATRVIGITADCDAVTVAELLDRLRAETAAAGPESPLQLEIGAGRATALSTQLLLSAAATLRGRDGFAGFGPRAAAMLGDETKNEG